VPAVAAFDSGNLLAVATALHERWPDKGIMIAGDDDHKLENNPGRVKALEAAAAVNGVAIFPELSAEQRDQGMTDFNDLGRAQPEVVSRQLVATVNATREGRTIRQAEKFRAADSTRPKEWLEIRPIGFIGKDILAIEKKITDPSEIIKQNQGFEISDFSEDKLQDSVGIKPPKTDRLNQAPSWEFRNRRKSFTPRQLARILWDFAYLCWANPIFGPVVEFGGPGATHAQPSAVHKIRCQDALFFCSEPITSRLRSFPCLTPSSPPGGIFAIR
jgi:hypothetical protein